MLHFQVPGFDASNKNIFVALILLNPWKLHNIRGFLTFSGGIYRHETVFWNGLTHERPMFSII